MFEIPATAIVIHSHGVPNTIPSPARTPFIMLSDGSSARGDTENLNIGNRHATETKNENASSANADEVPPNATIPAPNAGPMMPLISPLKLVNELALGK